LMAMFEIAMMDDCLIRCSKRGSSLTDDGGVVEQFVYGNGWVSGEFAVCRHIEALDSRCADE